MKKFTKVAVIIAGILAGIAVICTIVSLSLGLTWDGLFNIMRNGGINIAYDEEDGELDLVVGHREGDRGSAKDNTLVPTDKIEQNFQNLDVEFNAGILKISYGDVEEVQVEYDENVYHYYVKENTLHIKEKGKISFGGSEDEVVVLLPRNMTLREVDLEIDAGKAIVENLVAYSVDIEVGAGEANITGLDVTEFNADTGTGKMYVQLVGSEADYSYEAECGIGDLVIGETSVSGLGGSREHHNSGAKRHLELECGVGKMEIKFAQ